ncbi:hypothetical protein HN51_005587 [Arachis hypogaea]
MCSFSSQQTPLFFTLPWPSKKLNKHIKLSLLNRRRAQQLKEARERKRMNIEMKNLKLYMKNQSIIEENEKLRKQAMILHKENQELFSQLQKKLSEQKQYI